MHFFASSLGTAHRTRVNETENFVVVLTGNRRPDVNNNDAEDVVFLDIRCGENRIVAVVYGIAHMSSAIALRMHATREPQHPPSRTLIERVLSLSTNSLGVSVPKTVDFKLLCT